MVIPASIAALTVFIAACLVLQQRSIFFGEIRCPRCGPRVVLRRIPRHVSDRFLSKFVSCRKFQCVACGWSGLFRSGVARPNGEAPSGSDFDLQTFNDPMAFPKPERS